VSERVVLVDDRGRATGWAPKADVHDEHTPLHLAFSCYVFGPDDQLLLTRRAQSKATWPGVWTNSCCGHPSPGEDLFAAVHRRAQQELGLDLLDVAVVLPTFRYRATMGNGVVENELCPVLRARAENTLRPDLSEVQQTQWVSWDEFSREVCTGARAVSPWCTLQVRALVELGPVPRAWPVGDQRALPAACAVGAAT
jgi:isopentenyl-diphosphate Delta-isomerase